MNKSKGVYPTCFLPHLKKKEARIDKEIDGLREDARMNVMIKFDLPDGLVDEPEYQPLVQQEMLRLKKEKIEKRHRDSQN